MQPGRVKVQSYKSVWAEQFKQISSLLRTALGDFDIQHVGSTSVPGLAAKPIIDSKPEIPIIDIVKQNN